LLSRLHALEEAQIALKDQTRTFNASDAAKEQELDELAREAQDGHFGFGRKERDELLANLTKDFMEREKVRAALRGEDERIGREFDELKRDMNENMGVFR